MRDSTRLLLLGLLVGLTGSFVDDLLGAPGDAPFDPAYERLRRSLREAAPEGVDDPAVVLLTDGPGNSAWFEHRRLADQLGIPIVTWDDLDIRDGRVFAGVDGRRVSVDVV